jgi:hypothetical protein
MVLADGSDALLDEVHEQPGTVARIGRPAPGGGVEGFSDAGATDKLYQRGATGPHSPAAPTSPSENRWRNERPLIAGDRLPCQQNFQAGPVLPTSKRGV